jgi:hypothetical protein
MAAKDVSALAFLNGARSYHDAANQLFDVSQSRPKIGGRASLTAPINFLYFHTVELTLKAFLRSCGVPILGTERTKGHRLRELYDECRKLGLLIDPPDVNGIVSIVGCLDRGNEDQGFRYFNLNSTVEADLSWTHAVVEKLVRAVEPQVEARCKHEGPPRLSKMILVWGKPQSK